ncbi:MAG TPA: S9 family peptidase [Chitinophagaceae bacterium]|nr:S9 family peptidase [Chitinophagaceae bacterium]
MKKILFVVLFAILQYHNISAQTISALVSKKGPKIFKEHGRQRTDDYYWMNYPSDTNVINHLKAENAYVDGYMKHTADLQKKIYDELIARIPGRDESLPTKRNGYWYYTRFEEGKQYPYYVRKKGVVTEKEQIVLDVPSMAKGHQIYLVRGYNISPDNNYLAYAIDTLGDRRSTIYFRNISTGKDDAKMISTTSGNSVWANDNKTLYYVLNDHTVRAHKVMRHVLGTDPKTDKEIYTEKDSTYSVGLRKTKNKRYIFIGSGSTNTIEYRYLDADNPSLAPVLIQARRQGLEYEPDYYEGNVFHIHTNKDAKNFKIVTAPIANPSANNWQDLVPHSPKALVQDYDIFKNYYVVQTKENGLTQIKVYDRKNKTWSSINFGQDAYVASMSIPTDDYALDSIRYNFTSLVTPAATYAYNLNTKKKKLLKQQKVGDSYNPALYETKRLWATGREGTKIPLSIVYRKDKFKKDGSNPLLLYAYGSYGANSDPNFNSSVISLLDRGISFAIAHIRGGQEMGREWYEAGRVLTKKNTFNDFIDAAQFLVNEKYTAQDKLFANGGSAGGMLMGAVTNMRPDLFRGIIAEVPWMDVISDSFDPTIPLVTLEYEQWGDPNNKEHYEYLLSWSPLDNVKPAKYPAILATGGLHDTQVPYSSPAKWVAKVRENNLGTNPVLFRVEMGAGHGGQSGRFERQRLTALKYAFILDQLGWKE